MRSLRLALLAAASLCATACVSPYLRLHDSAKGLESAPTLLAAAAYGDDHRDESKDEKRSLLKAAVKVVSNLNLDDVGEHLVSRSIETGKTFGFNVTSDKARAQRLDLVKGGAMDALADVAQVVGGVWTYPEGSRNTSIDDRTWLTDSHKKDIAKSLDEAAPGEFFMFVSARHDTDREYVFFERGVVVLYMMVLSDEGRVVLEGRGIGYGDKSFWSEDVSVSGLRTTIDRAFKDMLAQPKERLK